MYNAFLRTELLTKSFYIYIETIQESYVMNDKENA